MSWRDRFAPIVQQVLQENRELMRQSIKEEKIPPQLAKAFQEKWKESGLCFSTKYWPYKVWRSEIRYWCGVAKTRSAEPNRLRIGPAFRKKKTRTADPDLLLVHQPSCKCEFCAVSSPAADQTPEPVQSSPGQSPQ